PNGVTRIAEATGKATKCHAGPCGTGERSDSEVAALRMSQSCESVRRSVGHGCKSRSSTYTVWRRSAATSSSRDMNEKGWCATFYTTGMEHSPTSADGRRVGAHAVARDAAGGVGGAKGDVSPGAWTIDLTPRGPPTTSDDAHESYVRSTYDC